MTDTDSISIDFVIIDTDKTEPAITPHYMLSDIACVKSLNSFLKEFGCTERIDMDYDPDDFEAWNEFLDIINRKLPDRFVFINTVRYETVYVIDSKLPPNDITDRITNFDCGDIEHNH